MVPQDEPPAPIEIGFLGQETSTFWGEGAEVVAAPEAAADTLASTEPSEASFVAFCRLCERLLATLEPAGKGHFNNRETAILVKKAFNDPTSLTSQQRKRFVSAMSKRLDDLSAEVADEFQKSDDHALYTSVVDYFMDHDRPSSKTSKAGAATSSGHDETSAPRSDLEAAALQYKALRDNPPGSAGVVLLGMALMIGGPALAILSFMSALTGGNSSGDEEGILFLCFGGIGLGVLLILAGTAGSTSHEKATAEAFQRMVSLSTTVKQEESAPTKNRWLASVIGLLFLVLFFGMLDMVLMLVWVGPLVWWEYSYHSNKQNKRTATEQAEMLIAIEQEINRK
ncbi:MAG: hypothetical protein ISP84_04185 [Candidatus Poseidonia sp.]|nr:hypothetical protein [Poseidonia sp.]